MGRVGSGQVRSGQHSTQTSKKSCCCFLFLHCCTRMKNKSTPRTHARTYIHEVVKTGKSYLSCLFSVDRLGISKKLPEPPLQPLHEQVERYDGGQAPHPGVPIAPLSPWAPRLHESKPVCCLQSEQTHTRFVTEQAQTTQITDSLFLVSRDAVTHDIIPGCHPVMFCALVVPWGSILARTNPRAKKDMCVRTCMHVRLYNSATNHNIICVTYCRT